VTGTVSYSWQFRNIGWDGWGTFRGWLTDELNSSKAGRGRKNEIGQASSGKTRSTKTSKRTDLGWSNVTITACAVAQHCYNGDVSFLWEKWKLWPPVKSKPLNRLTNNLTGLITCTRGTFVPYLVKKIRSRGTSGKGVKYNFLCDFLFISFSRTNVENRPLDGFWRAMAQKTRNRARMCLFGAIKWKIEIWPLFTPPNPKI